MKNTDMGNKYLEMLLASLGKTDKNRRGQFEEYFTDAPEWLIETIAVEEMRKGTIFVREGASADTIYLIANGIIKATDYRIYGIPFDFMVFSKVYAYGVMEILMEQDNYLTTLQTVTDCTVLKVSRAMYGKWLKSDHLAMQREVKLMTEYLLEQARNSRAFLFLQGSNRLAYLFLNHYDKYAENEVLTLQADRQELADYTGLCLKTITRSVKKFKEQGLITKEGSSIIITKEQYRKLREIVSVILIED